MKFRSGSSFKASTDCSTCPPCSNRQTGQRVSVREIRYQKQASTVRNMRAVLKKASWGTRRIIGSIRCKKQASTVREGYSVPETAFWCTERIFKGALNSLLLHRMHFRKRKKRHPVTLNASSKARRTADSTDCGKPSAAADASSVRDTAPFGGEQTKKVVTKNRDHFFDM